MKKIIAAQSRFFQAVPEFVRQYRKWVWAIFFITIVMIAPGVSKFQLDLTDEFFFQESDPVRLAYDRFREQFGGDESIYIVYRAKDGDVFSPSSLTALRGLQEELLNYRLQLQPGETSPLDHVVDITSLINVSYLEASNEALISRQFIGERLPQTHQQSDDYRHLAINHPDYPLLYVSEDSEYGGIVIRTDFKTNFKADDTHPQHSPPEAGVDEFSISMDDFDVTDMGDNIIALDASKPRSFETVEMSEYSEVMQSIRQIIEKSDYTQALEYYPVGLPPMNAFVWDSFVQQINMVMMLTMLFTLIMLWVLFRSLAAVVWPIVIIAVASVLTIAIFGWLGLKMNLMVNITVLLILVVGVADAVHILSGYLYFRNQGEDHPSAMRSTYEKSGLAVFLTSLTTGVGMLALMVVPLIPIQRFGMSAALGVFIAFFITVFMLPLMLDLWAPFSKKRAEKTQSIGPKHHLIQSLLQKIEHLSHKNPTLNIVIFSLIGVVFVIGIFKVQVDSNPISIFGEGNIIRTAFNLVDEKMGGTQSLEIMVDGGEDGAMQDPKLLSSLEALQHFLETEVDDVVLTRSLVNVVKDSNKSLNGGAADFYKIPDDPIVLQQMLFLFNNANSADRRKVVSDDYQKAHITVNMISNGSKNYVAALDVIREQIDHLFTPMKLQYPQLDVTVTGGVTIMVTLIDYLSWSQIKGFAIALLAISAILFIIFGSMRVGLIALYPNIFPLVIVFGTMGYMGIPLDVDTLIVAPLMIGIVVDDTIHFLTHYREEVIKHGDCEQAIVKAFREVGQAITFTSIILIAAFSTFILLDHQGMKSFGMLSAVAISTALLAELFLLPALLLKGKVTFSQPVKPAIASSATA